MIALRGEQHASLDLPNFASLFNESWNFVIESEKICSRMIVGLRGTMISQVGSVVDMTTVYKAYRVSLAPL